MNAEKPDNLLAYCTEVAQRARVASRELASVNGQARDGWLRLSAQNLRQQIPDLLEANSLDIAAAPGYGLTEAQIDRLRLTPERIESVAGALEQVASFPDPVGEVMESRVRPNGLVINKTRVPLGVVFFIYESRPNVTADAAALCVKSGNAVILRGGKEAIHSSIAIAEIMAAAATEQGIPADAVQLVNTTDRDAVGHFLKMDQLIDVAIPRGGESLIRRVSTEATMPVIKHYAGNCHVYIDQSANVEMAQAITINSKCHRMGVCNAAESLVVHSEAVPTILPRLIGALTDKEITIRGDENVQKAVPDSPVEMATDEDYAAEFLGPIISVKIVDSLDEAIEHINRFSSGHTEAIVTESLAAAEEFVRRVDSSAVMVNASTRFNDGGEFGLGAEIGISTDKFHARGPCGLKELTSYKYVVHGNGQIRQ